MAKSLNPNLAKIHRNYTVEDIAELLDVHKNTVRGWIKSGLPVCDNQKPMLILGSDLRDYLKVKKSHNKQKCQLWEFFCLRCRKPSFPVDGMVDYIAETDTTGRLIGLCSSCESVMNKYASISKLPSLKSKLDISFPTAQKHINKRADSLLNSDLKQ